jgi:hypothetical protein
VGLIVTRQLISEVQQPGGGVAGETDSLAKVIALAKDQIARLAGTEPENIRITIEI